MKGPGAYFHKLRHSSRARSFLGRNLRELEHSGCTPSPLEEPDVLDLVTVSFNSPWVIREQIQLLRANLQDAFHYTVADNSSDMAASREIADICRNEHIGYVRLPENPSREPSESHGLALTWAWRHYLKPRGASFIGFLDHDIFPVQPTRLISLIKKGGIFGHQQERGEVWYLWPGFCFFSRETLGRVELDFIPSDGLDTGGALWESLYSMVDRTKLPALPHRYHHVREGEDPQADWVEYFGDWMHVINASNWKGVADKSKLVQELLGGATSGRRSRSGSSRPGRRRKAGAS